MTGPPGKPIKGPVRNPWRITQTYLAVQSAPVTWASMSHLARDTRQEGRTPVQPSGS